jgi:hypothetical protein
VNREMTKNSHEDWVLQPLVGSRYVGVYHRRDVLSLGMSMAMRGEKRDDSSRQIEERRDRSIAVAENKKFALSNIAFSHFP